MFSFETTARFFKDCSIIRLIDYGHENEMYNVGLNLKEVECL